MARNTDPAMQTALLQGRQSTARPPRSPAYQQVNRLLSKDIPYVWYDRTVWAIGAQPKVQNFNNPTTPAGAKAFGMIGGADLAPADLALVDDRTAVVATTAPPARGGAVVP